MKSLVLVTTLVGRGAKLLLGALVVAAAIAVAMLGLAPDRAEATPVYSVCYPGDEVGYYEWYDDGQGNFTDHIGINECALDRLGAGPMDRQRVLEHELGHAAGYGHSDHANDTMHPYMVMWGV